MSLNTRAATWIFAALIATASFLPAPWKGRFSTTGMVHHGVHIAVFCAAVLLAGANSKEPRSAVSAAFVWLSMGCLLEIFQPLVYGSRFEYKDVCDDALGVAIGLAVVWAWRRHAGAQYD